VVDQLLFYISAAQDLLGEREILARLTIEIPVTLGWKIVQTPIRGEPLDRKMVLNANFHVIILGSDIRAPVGVEWMLARSAPRSPVLFAKSGILRTAAAEDFQRTLAKTAHWIAYKDTDELRLQTARLLADHILGEAIRYALQPDEFEGLRKWRIGLDEEQISAGEVIRGGVSEGAIVLSKERYLPSEGVLLGPANKSQASSEKSGEPS
jgi:hypothetical protein